MYLQATTPLTTALPSGIQAMPTSAHTWFRTMIAEIEEEIEEDAKAPAKLSAMLTSSEVISLFGDHSNSRITQNTSRNIKLGNILNEMKRLVKVQGLNWGIWADANIPLKERTREKFMRIARANIDAKWHYLGTESLDRICKSFKAFGGSLDSANPLIEVVVKRCGEDVFDDQDQRLEAVAAATLNACHFMKCSPDKFVDLSLLIESCENGLVFQNSLAEEFKTASLEEVNEKLELAIEVGGHKSLGSSPAKPLNIRSFNAIYQDIVEYHKVALSSGTSDAFEDTQAHSMIAMIQDTINARSPKSKEEN